MANVEQLKTQIASVIKSNGVQSITGANFQAQLFNIIDTLNEAKVDAESGKGLSSNDLTNTLVGKINSAVQAAGLSQAIADAIATAVLKSDIVQATGTSASVVMSQKAVSDALNGKANNAEVLKKTDIATDEGSSDAKVMSQRVTTTILSQKANATDVFTKAEVNTSLNGKANKADTYTKQEVNAQVATKIGADYTYSKNEIDTRLLQKASTDALDLEAQARIQADAAINTTLDGKANIADIYTKSQTDSLVGDVSAKVARLLRDFGQYADPQEVVLASGVAGKYVDATTGTEVSNSSYSISQAIDVLTGDIILIPSASAVLAACSVVSQVVTNTYPKVILYTYTYDDKGRVATATADYDGATYTAHYADEESTMADYWIRGAEHLAALPATHDVTESYYEPLVKQSVPGMPDEGYYVYLASRSMRVVISGFNATINGGKIIRVGWGIFKNIATNFVGHPQQRVIADALCDLARRVEGMENRFIDGLGELRVDRLVVGRELSGLNENGNFCLQGAGEPSVSVVPSNWDFERYGDWLGVPQFIGQEYIDTEGKVAYKACGINAVSDWKRITNA